MKYIIIFIAVLFFGPANSQDLQTVIKNSNAAMGIEFRKTLPNLQTSGHAVMTGTDSKIPFKLLQAKPDLLRLETTVFGFRSIQTYDGITAWSLTPMQGMEPVKTDTRDMEFIAAATSIDGPFSVNKDNKYVLKYGGADTYLEKPVEVMYWSSDKERLKYYISTETWLVDGVRYEYQKNGGWYSMEYRIKSYRDFMGSMFPLEVTAVVNGVEMLSLFITDLRTVAQIDMKRFGKPSFM
ncbi:MAG: hypothetical protein LC655_02675 [Bacteroidales bacterium]|nr:hypothetical protein [Bacteroidales bacterium]